MSELLKTNLLGVELKNPVIAASGTFGFGREYGELFDISKLGGISSKGLTLNPFPGNNGIRVWETPSGMLNSIGLENPGVRGFIEHEYTFMKASGAAVIANMGGHSEEDYIKGAELLNSVDIDILELNISCPNVKQGGMAFGILPDTAGDIVKKVKAVSKHPLLVKLSPNAADITDVARACEYAGADGISLVNTFLGMAIDIRTRKAVFDNVYAGLSGPAILPIALRMVHQVCKAVNIPVVGIGGIANWQDALAFIMAGATAVQVGTATFMDPAALLDIIKGLNDYCVDNNIKNICEVKGIV